MCGRAATLLGREASEMLGVLRIGVSINSRDVKSHDMENLANQIQTLGTRVRGQMSEEEVLKLKVYLCMTSRLHVVRGSTLWPSFEPFQFEFLMLSCPGTRLGSRRITMTSQVQDKVMKLYAPHWWSEVSMLSVHQVSPLKILFL